MAKTSLVAALGLAACSGKAFCERGETQLCVCAGGSVGAQVCAEDAWGTCACDPGASTDAADTRVDPADPMQDDSEADVSDPEVTDPSPPADPADTDEPVEPPTPPAGPDLANGEALFGGNCHVCHGADGRGSFRGPDLAEPVWEEDDADLVETILFGDDGMPAFSWMTPAQAMDIVAWLRTTLPWAPHDEDGDDDHH